MRVRIGHVPPDWGCWQDTRIHVLSWRWPACSLGKPPPRRSGDSAAWSPPGPRGGPFLPVTVAVFAGDSPSGRPGGQIHSRRPRLLARPRVRWRSSGSPGSECCGEWCRPTLGQPVRCAAQARELRRGAIRRACRRGALPYEGSGAARGSCPGTGRQATCPPDGRRTEPGSRRRTGAVRAAPPQTAIDDGGNLALAAPRPRWIQAVSAADLYIGRKYMQIADYVFIHPAVGWPWLGADHLLCTGWVCSYLAARPRSSAGRRAGAAGG